MIVYGCCSDNQLRGTFQSVPFGSRKEVKQLNISSFLYLKTKKFHPQ